MHNGCRVYALTTVDHDNDGAQCILHLACDEVNWVLGHCYRAADLKDTMPLHGMDHPAGHTAFAGWNEVLVDDSIGCHAALPVKTTPQMPHVVTGSFSTAAALHQRHELHNLACLSSLRSLYLQRGPRRRTLGMRLRSSQLTAASAEPGLPPTGHKERLPDMELERQALKTRTSSGSIGASSRARRKPVRVAGLDLSPELVAIALGAP